MTQMMAQQPSMMATFRAVITRAVGPTSNAMFSAMFSTLATPASFVFLIWPVIGALQLLTVLFSALRIGPPLKQNELSALSLANVCATAWLIISSNSLAGRRLRRHRGRHRGMHRDGCTASVRPRRKSRRCVSKYKLPRHTNCIPCTPSRRGPPHLVARRAAPRANRQRPPAPRGRPSARFLRSNFPSLLQLHDHRQARAPATPVILRPRPHMIPSGSHNELTPVTRAKPFGSNP